MEKLIAGAAVFFAVVCGQPDLLAVLCFYLIFSILLAILSSFLARQLRTT